MRPTSSHIVAIVSLTLISIWMLSGTPNEEDKTDRPLSNSEQSFQVEYDLLEGQTRQQEIRLSGHIAASRKIDITSEVSGKVEKILSTRGSFAKEGDILLKLEDRDWPAKLAQSKANLQQAELELTSTQRLFDRGLANDTQLVSAKAQLAAAKANVIRTEIKLKAIEVRAPFDGIFDQRFVEQGQFVDEGSSLLRFLDNTPMLVKAHITEKHIDQVKKGDQAYALLSNGTQIEGRIGFIASSADPQTRTYDIEMRVSSDELSQPLFDGQTATLYIPGEEVYAYFVSPALFVMKDNNQLGLKILTEQNQVDLTPISILNAEDKGVWVSSPYKQLKLITLGQGFVSKGEQVQAVAKRAEEE